MPTVISGSAAIAHAARVIGRSRLGVKCGRKGMAASLAAPSWRCAATRSR
jgi:hypothetical protein